jgi:uncharacterized protein YabN with tetrapyrrole methylase and pyrophosphatase domain
LLFAVVNLARKKKLDAEQTLDRATTKFSNRFQEMERLAKERGLELASLSLEEMDRLWEDVKETAWQRRGNAVPMKPDKHALKK